MIDPTVDDPLDHIEWRPVNPGASVDKLRWRPVHKTARGRVTIEVLGWEKLGLPDHVNTHISRIVYPRVKKLREGMARGDEGAVGSEWNQILEDLLDARMPHLAATHDALAYFVPADERQRLGLDLRRPGSFEARRPSVVFHDPPDIEELPLLLQWELRALGERADPGRRDRVLIASCLFRSRSLDALSALTGLGAQHLQRCLGDLVARRALTTRTMEGGTVVYQAGESGTLPAI